MLDEIKKNLNSEKMIIGKNETLRNLKLNKLAKVFLASNTDEAVRKDFEYYCNLANTPLIQLEIPNDELGVVCKKQFSISVLSLLK